MYYATHSFFMSDRAIYLLVIKLTDVDEKKLLLFFLFILFF